MALLTSNKCTGEVHVVVVDGSTAASGIVGLRVDLIREAGARAVVVVNSAKGASFAPSLQLSHDDGAFERVDSEFNVSQLSKLGREEVGGVVDRCFVILPISELSLKQQVYSECRRLRIPVNVSDSPELCTFTLLLTYSNGDFHLGVSTSGKGCKLASRIKRELVGHLPKNIGAICDTVGQLRKRIQEEDDVLAQQVGEHDDDAITTSKLNSLVEEFNQTKEQQRLQRLRWLSQIVEYYPLSKLSDLSLDDLTEVYKSQKTDASVKRRKLGGGHISLVGLGPGSVSLLTLGAIQEIYNADLILADKLVPQQVLDLIPQKTTKLFIARKFPGNAERAQQELLLIGLDALNKGERVVRLKQGDPYIFGRGGEEFNFFSSHGYTPIVLPGITSALSAPVLGNIPVTHREVADQVLICTGTGRRGVLPDLPDFHKSRTTVFLMALHRVVDLIPHLINEKGWDAHLPVAIIERSSCPDQRIIRTTLGQTARAVEECGSRPPGLLVTGYSCEVITKGQKAQPWIVEEGFEYANANLDGFLRLASSLKDTHFVERDLTATPPPENI